MDEDEVRQYQERRETFLTIFLTLLAAAGGLLFLILVTGGFFLYVMIGVVLVAAGGCFHYLLWGKLFSEEVAGEREEMAGPRAAPEDEVVSAVKHSEQDRPC
jgi:fatty acid desaturase